MVARIGPNKPIKVFLREWRQHFRLSQDELAARLNTSKATVSRKENQKRGYDVGYIAAVAEVLGREFTEMFCDPARPTQADLLRDMPEPDRTRIVAFIETFKKTGTG